MIKIDKKIIVTVIICGIIFGSIGVYAGSNMYADSISINTPTGSNLGSDATLQSALDELYSIADNNDEIEKRLTALENNTLTLDKMYPVGSIYISTDITSASDVAAKFGGTWESYGSGRTLVSSGSNGTTNYTAGSTGGSSTTTLSTSNLPSHTHTYTPSGTITSSIGNGGSAMTIYANSNYSGYGSSGYGFVSATNSWWSTVNKNYGTISSKFNGSSGSTTGCTNCSGTSFSVQNPYIVVYMYKRVK